MWQNPLNAFCSDLSNSNENQSVKIDFVNDGSISSSFSKHGKRKNNNRILSPYLDGDKVRLISRVTEKRLVHKKASDFVSSFPLAVGIYKANSDEFKTTRKASKKNKKSVLTLPNEPVPLPQTCTVSDMNDSEYFKVNKEERKPRAKKKRHLKNNRKFRSKDIEFYDRDARYCSQLNIDLDCSSTDLIENLTGIENSNGNKLNKKPIRKSNFKAHDVWTILRNINRFQFRPSPSPSEDSVISIKKKKKNSTRLNNCKDKRFIESCRTEEFAYISSYDLDNNSYSQSSLDRITVIDKQDELEIFQESKKDVDKIKPLPKVLKNKRYKKNKLYNTKAIANNVNAVQEKDKDDEMKHNNKYSKGDNSTSIELYHNIDVDIKKDQNSDIISQKDSSESQCKSTILPFKRANSRDLKDERNNQNVIYGNRKKLDQKMFSNSPNECNNTQISRVNTKDSDNWNISDEDKIKQVQEIIYRKGSQEQINGITKIIVNKEQSNLTSKPIHPKPRLLTTMPSTLIAPKLTQTDIKRRLANIKFPLVILGKDQLSSSMQVTNYEPVQFSGLDKHIWPFMLNWFNDGNKYKSENKKLDSCNKNKRKWLLERNNINNCNSPRANYVSTGCKQLPNNVIPKENNIKSLSEPKTKPIKLKEKIMKFMSQRNSARGGNSIIRTLNSGRGYNKISYGVDASTETQTNFLKRDTDASMNPTIKYPWANGKGTSDFIDNIIKKIKNGAYYDQEFKDIFKYMGGSNEESTQTESRISNHIIPIDITSEVHIEMKQDELKTIPGFDETLTELEIETFSRRQIAVKHCVTNVVVTFDIAVPTDAKNILQLKQSISCIPLRVTENQTKIFKCRNTILNAVLPAELCTILPEMMRNIINANSSLGLSKVTTDKVDSQLSTISELTPEIPTLKPDTPISMNTSPLLKAGHFSRTISDIGLQVKSEKIYIKTIKSCFNVNELLPNVLTNIIFTYKVNPAKYMISGLKGERFPKSVLRNQEKENSNLNRTLEMLQPLKLSSKALLPAYKRFTLLHIFKEINDTTNIPNKQFTIASCNITMIINFIKNIDLYNKQEVPNPKEIDSLFNRQSKCTIDQKRVSDIKGQNFEITKAEKNNRVEKRKSKTECCVTSSRNRKINFVRLYKKCKSMSNISGGGLNTMLSKITNLDEFCQALGSVKALSNVLDGSSEKKILSSLAEMKSWMSTITPRQALLVLLLCNKKDTPNLVRYRPVILQGIAVNRITRASELDMEIEVIEKENMNKIPQYEGITYLPASVENQDTLLEELCWIAKTTASDYQKTFDESSERLLKSLLQKRKKLNPSYLRVMARYVGLGLLKQKK